MANKYIALSLNIINKDPSTFIRQRLGKMFYVWEKHYLFYYGENPVINDTVVYWGNMFFLLLGLAGIGYWWNEVIHTQKKNVIIAGVITSFILYISLIHSISLAEERYSLPGYPIIFLFSGYMLWILWLKYHKKSKN